MVLPRDLGVSVGTPEGDMLGTAMAALREPRACDNFCDKTLSPTPEMPPAALNGVDDMNPARVLKETTYQELFPR